MMTMGCEEFSVVVGAVLKVPVQGHRPVIPSTVTPGWHAEPQILGSIMFQGFRTKTVGKTSCFLLNLIVPRNDDYAVSHISLFDFIGAFRVHSKKKTQSEVECLIIGQ